MRSVVADTMVSLFSVILAFSLSLVAGQWTETLAELGTLYPFTPPPDCSLFSARTSGFLQFGDTRTRILYSTSFQQGCYSSRTSCCPRNFGRGFYSPASGCPPGYTKHETITFSGRRYIGFTYELSEKRGDVCCPSVVDPVTEYEYTPVFGSCDGSFIRLVTGSETFESYYGASAIVVVTEAGLPGTTPAETSTTTSTSSSSATVRSGSDREIPSETGSKISSTSETSTAPRTESELSTSTGLKTSSTSSNPVPSKPLPSGGTEGDSKTPNNSNKKGLSTGAKAGIAVGVTVPVLIGLIYAVYLFSRRRGKAPVPAAVGTSKYGGEAQDVGFGGIHTDNKI
ncbi:hypothetical protein TWF970_003071 [Orbilia oligospora]|uniref:Mid2 domain-containing protein n=1 Tax=Orbilia oligospora TaxID=2813651 RepID=A0A7C8VY75_ORBOL|nr:hypothetical protein TWF970_003071 [Orbilia oligospora]